MKQFINDPKDQGSQVRIRLLTGALNLSQNNLAALYVCDTLNKIGSSTAHQSSLISKQMNPDRTISITYNRRVIL